MRLVVLFCASTLAAAGPADRCMPPVTGQSLMEEKGYDMAGKVVVSIGNSLDTLGYSTCLNLARAGATIVLLGHDMAHVKAAADGIESATGVRAHTFFADLGDLSSLPPALENTLAVTDRVDVLLDLTSVPNVPLEQSAWDITIDGFERTLQVNLLGQIRLTELFLPVMRQSQGRLVFGASTTGLSYNVSAWPSLLRSRIAGDPVDDIWAVPILNDPPCPVIARDSGCHCPAAFEKIAREPAGLGSNIQRYLGERTNTPLAMMMKTFYTYELHKRETANGVQVLMFHPGVVFTKGTKKVVADGGADFAALCDPKTNPGVPWFACCCSDINLEYVDGVCPLTPEYGSVSPTFLSAAPPEETAKFSGNWTINCDDSDTQHVNHRLIMINKWGRDYTEKFGIASFDVLMSMLHPDHPTNVPNLVEVTEECPETLEGGWQRQALILVLWFTIPLLLCICCCSVLCCCLCYRLCCKRKETAPASSPSAAKVLN